MLILWRALVLDQDGGAVELSAAVEPDLSCLLMSQENVRQQFPFISLGKFRL